ncbi:uncharacterized protein LOC115213356 [Argonauta hians]
MSKLFCKLASMTPNGLFPRSVNYFSTLCKTLPSSLTNSTALMPARAAGINADPNANHKTILRNDDHNPALLQQSIRSKKVVVYKGNVWKRVHIHSLHRRILTKGGIEIIWRRLIKGRNVLTAYDGFLFDNYKKTKSSLTQSKIYRENKFIKKKTVAKKSFLLRPSAY